MGLPKNKHIVYGLMLIVYILTSFTPKVSDKYTTFEKIDLLEVSVPIKEKPKEIIKEVNELELFLNKIGFKESGNRYDVVNKYGYMGKYQFGKSTLSDLGYNVSKKEFLNAPEMQESAMIDLLKHNKRRLSRTIKKYKNTTVNGVYITESGILASAHLAGVGGVRSYLKYGKNKQDGFGTKISTYMKKFGGYKIKLK
jgi:hypothetical protein